MDILKMPLCNSNPNRNLADTGDCIYAPETVAGLYKEQQLKEVAFLNRNKAIPKLGFRSYGITSWRDNIDSLLYAFFAKSDKERVGFIGGDHSISFYTFWQFCNYWGKDNTLLISLDAHPDLTRKGKERPYHSDWLRFLIDEGFDPRRVIGLGWRDIEEPEYCFIKDKDVNFFGVKELLDLDTLALRGFGLPFEWRNNLSRFKTYLTVDLDVLSPAFAPGVSSPSHFGLSDREFIGLIGLLVRKFDIRAFDVVELNPRLDVNNLTARLALDTLFELYSSPLV